MIKTVMRPVEMTVCDACHNKGKDIEAVTKASMSLGNDSRTVDLCEEHKGLFVAVMDKLMPVASVADAAAPVAVKEAKAEASSAVHTSTATKEDTSLTTATAHVSAVQEPATTQAMAEDTQEAPARVSRHEDLQDYCQRITDSRRAVKGRKLNVAEQSARAQWARHRSRFQGISQEERSHFIDWAEYHGKGVGFTASHVEFRGWLWENFPAKAESYVAKYKNTQDVKTPDVPSVESGTEASSVTIRDNIGRPIVKANEVRAWARENGYQVADRGRIPANIREAYKQAQETEGKATAA